MEKFILDKCIPAAVLIILVMSIVYLSALLAEEFTGRQILHHYTRSVEVRAK